MAAHRARGRRFNDHAPVHLVAGARVGGGRHRAPVRHRRHLPSLAAILATLSVAGGVTLLVPTAQAADVASDAALTMHATGGEPGSVMALLLILIGAVTVAVSRWRQQAGCRHPGRHL